VGYLPSLGSLDKEKEANALEKKKYRDKFIKKYLFSTIQLTMRDID
jgi:hypothetical protein